MHLDAVSVDCSVRFCFRRQYDYVGGYLGLHPNLLHVLVARYAVDFFKMKKNDFSNCVTFSHLLQLKNLTVELLEKRRLSHGKVSAYGTPRRLVVTTLICSVLEFGES